MQGSILTHAARVPTYLKEVSYAEAIGLVILINVSTRRYGLGFLCGTVDPLATSCLFLCNAEVVS